jgi:hypothetical protein
MSHVQQRFGNASAKPVVDLDAIVVGPSSRSFYTLHRLRGLRLRASV